MLTDSEFKDEQDHFAGYYLWDYVYHAVTLYRRNCEERPGGDPNDHEMDMMLIGSLVDYIGYVCIRDVKRKRGGEVDRSDVERLRGDVCAVLKAFLKQQKENN